MLFSLGMFTGREGDNNRFYSFSCAQPQVNCKQVTPVFASALETPCNSALLVSIDYTSNSPSHTIGCSFSAHPNNITRLYKQDLVLSSPSFLSGRFDCT